MKSFVHAQTSSVSIAQLAPKLAPGVPDPNYFAAVKTLSPGESQDIEVTGLPSVSQANVAQVGGGMSCVTTCMFVQCLDHV